MYRAGLSFEYILPEDLILYLEDYGISYLSDALNWGNSTTSTEYWLTAEELELGGHWKVAWTQYIKGLHHGGVCISNSPNTLVWMYNKMTGWVKANLMYELIANISVTSRPADTFVKIWKFCIPLKIICFSWLCLSNMVHTWDNLIKKGWIGPNWSCLRSAFESVDHLFHDCSFTRLVTAHIRSSLGIPFFWKESNYTHNVSSWISKGNNLIYLPLLLTWQIWLARNKCLFEDKKPDLLFIIHTIMEQLQLYPIFSQ